MENKKENKKISVIMGVYNCDDTLKDALDSIINQTYSNWELVVCDDASSDNTYEILRVYKEAYKDKIILLQNDKNSKLHYTLNKCLEFANGHYIARMDGDDISAPDRFEKQVKFLNDNPDIDLVGTSMQRFTGDEIADIDYSIKGPDRYTLKKNVPFNHATIMTYKYVYDKLDGYTVSKRTERCEDYDLWFRFFHEDFKGENIKEPLYFVRENLNAIRRRTIKSRFNAYKTTIIGFNLLEFPLHWYLGPTVGLLVKSLIPSKGVLMYRNYQKNKFKNSKEQI